MSNSTPLDRSERLIASLRQPAMYPGGDVTSVKVIETHISWVLLTGQFAYKIKKPVDLGFVDFSTLERRRLFCTEELRLNGRLAPNLYLDVVPISGTPEAPELGSDRQPFEYAVRMRQFQQDDLLSHRAGHQGLSVELAIQLAEVMARFHAEIPRAESADGFGTPAGVLAPVQANFDALETVVQQAASRAPEIARLLGDVRDWSLAEHTRLRETFDARLRDGFVRECHGDLHLGNIFVEGNRVVPFDGIEFNAGLRWIDVISEAAFLSMDLEDRGEPTLSRLFFNAYLEATGDYAGLKVYPFYRVYRAAVRAKVAGIRLQQESPSSPQYAELLDEVLQYLSLAWSYTRPRQQALVITSGLSGSGKTTAAVPLIEQLELIRIRSDVERKRMFGLRPAEQSHSAVGQGLYTLAANRQTYDRLAELAAEVLDSGFGVIVDATFLQRAGREPMRQLARRHGVPFVILQCTASDDVLRDRIRSRSAEGRDASEADLSVLSRQQHAQEVLTDEERLHAVSVDTSAIDDVSNRIVESVRSRMA